MKKTKKTLKFVKRFRLMWCDDKEIHRGFKTKNEALKWLMDVAECDWEQDYCKNKEDYLEKHFGSSDLSNCYLDTYDEIIYD